MNVSTKLAAILTLATSVSACHKAPVPTQAPATRVKIAAVQDTLQSSEQSYSGTVEESSGTMLSFSTAGTINRMNVSAGDYVSKGQLIATVDASSLKNAYDIALATLNQAQDAYDRMKQLHDANALPDMKWVEVQNALSQAQSAAAIAKKAMADATLYSPVSGYVSEKIADVGMNVAPGMPVIKVVDINTVKVNISIPENEITSIPNNSVADITVGAMGGRTYQGKLIEKGVVANPLSRTYDVKYRVDNPDKDLLPGMICDVTVSSDTPHNVISVPADAVLLDADNRNFVWIAADGKAQKRIVETGGMTADTHIVIKSGLAAGDSLIVSGQQKVSEGTPVVNIH